MGIHTSYLFQDIQPNVIDDPFILLYLYQSTGSCMVKGKLSSGFTKIRSALSILISFIFAIFVIPILYVYFNFFVYRSPYNRPVYTFMPPISLEFHKCFRCNSYDGGVYGKGPCEHFRSEKAKRCKHKWQQISKEAFITGVRSDFNVDLAKNSSPIWQTEQDSSDD